MDILPQHLLYLKHYLDAARKIKEYKQLIQRRMRDTYIVMDYTNRAIRPGGTDD